MHCMLAAWWQQQRHARVCADATGEQRSDVEHDGTYSTWYCLLPKSIMSLTVGMDATVTCVPFG